METEKETEILQAQQVGIEFKVRTERILLKRYPAEVLALEARKLLHKSCDETLQAQPCLETFECLAKLCSI